MDNNDDSNGIFNGNIGQIFEKLTNAEIIIFTIMD